MGRAAKLKKVRRRAEELTKHLPAYERDGTRLGECTRGAYKALKRGKFRRVEE